MTEITWIAVVGVLLLIGQLTSLYNGMKQARKNASEPLEKMNARLTDLEKHVTKIDFSMNDIHRDLDKAHEKIRENKEETSAVAKAQNEALIQILLLLKNPGDRDDARIDDAIKRLSHI